MTLTEQHLHTRRSPSERLRDPILGWTGIGSFVVTIAVLFIPHEVLGDHEKTTAADVTEFFTTNYTIQQSQTLLHSVGAVLLLVFLLRVAALLARLGGGGAADVVRAASSVLVAVVVITMGFVATVVTLHETMDGNLVESLYQVGWDWHFRLLYLLPLILLPTGIVLRRAGEKATGWATLTLGGLTAVAPLGYLAADTFFVHYPAFMLFLLWVLGAGISLGLRGVRTSGPLG